MIMSMQQQLRTGLLLLLGLSTACLNLACSDSDEPEEETGTEDQFPADTSEASVAAFLDAETYKSWRNDPEIREGGSVVNVHGDHLRVYLNEAAVTSHSDTVGENNDAAPGSMAVKEIYDDSGTLLGRAASLLDESGDWTYYCNSTDVTFCTGATIDMPVYNDFACSSCHGDQIYAPLPE